MSGEEFQYAHLIKFERPSRPDSITGKVSTHFSRFTHLTDASRDVAFDDGSKDSFGVSNGTQTYLANKILKVSEVSESTEAKATNFNVVIDGNGLGASVQAQNVNIVARPNNEYDIEFVDKTVDLVYEGFREGDKIQLTGGQTGHFNIVNFRENNVLRVKKIDDNLTEGNFTINAVLSSEEVRAILMDKSLTDYSSFLNREVYIYKAYIKDGLTVGEPLLLFKGIISNVSFDDGDRGIQVTWGLTSHWGDFAQVKGRISSDDFHRALDQNGNPQPLAALKPEYAYDRGFMHSETSINSLAKYIVKVEKTKVKAKNGILGLGAKTKVKKYYVDEDRFTQLDLQLAAKAIPLHYGVRFTEGFPIFADTLVDDSASVYVAYAIGEGPIGGLYDIYVDGKSLICTNKGDFEARSQQNDDSTVEVICRGRADRGDVLEGQTSTDGNTTIDFYGSNPPITNRGPIFQLLLALINYNPYVPPTEANYSSTGRGVQTGESIKLTSPIDMVLDFFNGTTHQLASSQLVDLAKNNKFKVQNDYWLDKDGGDYWGPNHRLADTAYAVVNYKISEGETTIPSLEFIIRGKLIKCYNYDYSYAPAPNTSGENADNFDLGDIVDIHRADTDAIINSSVKIIDKWTLINGNGDVETRFRFSQPPALGYVEGVPTIKKLYMKKGANTWTMVTYNYTELTGTVTERLEIETEPYVNGDDTIIPTPGGDILEGGYVGSIPVFSGNNNPEILINGDLTNTVDIRSNYGFSTLIEE